MGMDPWSAGIIKQNQRWLTAYILSLTGSPDAADDLVQESFTIAYQKRHTFKAGTNFGAWLRTIAKNVALRHLQKRKMEPVLAEPRALEHLDHVAADVEPTAVSEIWWERRIAFLRDCIGKLTERLRRILRMRYHDRWRSGRIAKMLNMTVSAVNVSVFRARESLADCIHRKENQGDNFA